MSSLPKLLVKGGNLARQGDIAGARAVFEKAVRDHPDRAEAWINLSATSGMEGNYAEALRCARKATELEPRSLQAWMNLAHAAQSTGEVAQSIEAFQRAQALPGCPPRAALELGLALAQSGQPAEAEKHLRAYLALDPGHRDATFALERILARRGEMEAGALAEKYCQQHPADVEAICRLGAIYLDLGRVEDARRACDQAMARSPGAAGALFFKAALLTFEGRYSEARDVYEQVNRQEPNSLRVLLMLSNVCRQMADHEASIAYSRAALDVNPRNLDALVYLSTALLAKDAAEARRLMEQAMAIAPENLAAQVLKGRILEFEGDKLGAWECVRAAIERGSLDPEAALLAASVAPAVHRTDEAIELLERLAARPGISATDERMLRFALAQVCDKAKQYDRAFGHAVIANRLKNAYQDVRAHVVEIERLKFVYSESAMASLPRSRIHSELPIFIVGMPRSGTSLLEQILSCHSKVHARGETTDIGKVAETVPYYPDGVRNLDVEKLDALAGDYLKRLQDMASSASRVTDKLPGNYMYLGFINQLFPGARVLNCRRDPRDICLSNYFIEFRAGHTHSYDLESLAQVYKTYEDLMAHWKSVLPIPIMDVQYEELIEEPRAWVEAVLRFCGLEWEDACLDFHQSKRQVLTASYDQVRRPLYKSSKARWKNYARHLEPVNRILGLKSDTD